MHAGFAPETNKKSAPINTSYANLLRLLIFADLYTIIRAGGKEQYKEVRSQFLKNSSKLWRVPTDVDYML